MALECIAFNPGDELLLDIGDYEHMSRILPHIRYRHGRITELFEKTQQDGNKKLIARVDFVAATANIPYDLLKKHAKLYFPKR